jgi:hypothetical protein
MYRELYRADRWLIKYMSMVKLYDKDFAILDRYRGYLKIIREYNIRDRDAFILLHKLFKDKELELFKDDVNDYIIYALRKNVIRRYLDGKSFVNLPADELFDYTRGF